MLKIIDNDTEHEPDFTAQLDELVREGARRMLHAALEAEVEAYIERHRHERDESGRRRVGPRSPPRPTDPPPSASACRWCSTRA